MRVDFNIEDEEMRDLRRVGTVPLRISAIVPTIQFLRARGARVVLLSHRGRPLHPSLPSVSPKKETRKPTLRPFTITLTKLLGIPISFFPFNSSFVARADFSVVRKRIAALPPRGVMLLGNLRFFEGEALNDEVFAGALASLGTLYVNDAFAVSHRANASVSAITSFLPSYAGLLLEEELVHLSKIMRAPKKPLVVILGGGKVYDKIEVICSFYKNANQFLIGGGIANTFLAAQGLPVGDSLFDPKADTDILEEDRAKRAPKIVLPEDFVIHDRAIFDIGPRTIARYRACIARAQTIIWNGPMGYIEDPRFETGTKSLVRAILTSRAFTVVGGGETTGVFQEVLKGSRRAGTRIFLSTGGGAMLQYLAGKPLPGLEALKHTSRLTHGNRKNI